MSLMRLRALRAGFALVRPMAASTSRAAVVAMRSSSAMTRVSLQTGPTSARMFSVLTPALYPAAATKKTTTQKTTTKKKAAPKKKAATKTRAVTKTKAGTRKKAAPKKKAATRGKAAAKPKSKSRKRKVLTPEERAQKRRDLYAKQKRDELKAIPKPPKRAPTAYGLFLQKEFPLHHVSGQSITSAATKIASAWKALSDAERQRFKDQAVAIKPLHEAQYEKWAKTVGYDGIRKLNHARLRAGKQKFGIPDVVRPISKTSAYVTFFQEKYASGELRAETIQRSAARAGELWRQLSPADKAAYEARSAAAYKQKLARQA